MSPQAKAPDSSPYSLQKRLLLAFGLLLFLFLVLAGVVLDRAYKDSVEEAVQERLQLQIYALLGVAEPETDGFFLPDLKEARFAQIDSGLYGLIVDTQGVEVWRSPSALHLAVDTQQFMETEQLRGETLYGSLEVSGEGDLLWASYATYWQTLEQTYSFIVMESATPSDAEIRGFRYSLYQWFGAMAIFLSAAQYGLLRWGMQPLKHLAADVSAIESGAQDQLNRHYPSELETVTRNLNLLIKSERERQARYRTTLGDLAHSLKTPLAVLTSSLEERLEQLGDSSAQESRPLLDMEEQVRRMADIVTYQLKRAAKTNSAALLAKPVAATPVLEKIINALQKVYRDKQMGVEMSLQADTLFYGEQSDLMEVSGNLLDNAFKYGRSRIKVELMQKGRAIILEVNDDGAGIAEENHKWVLERGARADTVKSGQGIGLAVAVEIVSAYGGEIKVSRNDWGGACFKVRFG